MSLWAHSDGAGKRRLVAQLLSIRGVNESTVGRILRLLEPQQSLTKWAIHNVLSTQAESVVTHVKLPLKDGGEFSWPIACPQDLLPLCLSECAGFREVFEQALSAQPATFCRPWRLLIYLDEITPGNPLRPDNKRKNHGVLCQLAGARGSSTFGGILVDPWSAAHQHYQRGQR